MQEHYDDITSMECDNSSNDTMSEEHPGRTEVYADNIEFIASGSLNISSIVNTPASTQLIETTTEVHLMMILESGDIISLTVLLPVCIALPVTPRASVN